MSTFEQQGVEDWREWIDRDGPDVGPVTLETVEAMRLSRKGDARVALGKVWTDEEFEERRRRVLSTPLP